MRLLSFTRMLFTLALAGCGSDEASPEGAAPGDMSGEMTPANDDDGSAADRGEPISRIELMVEGEAAALIGSARLEVRELNPVVNLVITTVFPSNEDDLVRLELDMMGVEQAMGAHSEPLSGDGASAALAIAYIGRVSYLSESGTLDVRLADDGSIEGSFEAELVPDLAGSSTASAIAADPFSISGRFEGTWVLVCSSPVLGLPGDHSSSDSAYCRGLEF